MICHLLYIIIDLEQKNDPMIESIDHVDITAQKEAGKIYTLLVLTSMLH